MFAVIALDQRTSWLFERGGFLLLALAAAAAVFATTQPSKGPMHRLVESPPTRYLGRITYGVYLYHWPIFLVLGTIVTGASLVYGLILVPVGAALLVWSVLGFTRESRG